MSLRALTPADRQHRSGQRAVRQGLVALLALGFLACLGLLPCTAAIAAATANRPNLLVVMVDDAALMDFGAYGGEAQTPNIDALAASGTRFTQYHTSPLCAPSRAMLLTGLDSHQTGVASIPEILPKEQVGQPGYAMRLEPGVATIADHLAAAGYRTLMTGKWHLGHGSTDLPNAHGFQRSFALDASGADNWEQKPYMPYYASADWFEDGRPARLPPDFYSSAFLVDKLIDYLDEDASRPFFAYLAFQAIHIPVQAPREFTERYATTYADGWEVLRERRLARARALGLIPATASIKPLPAGLRPWSSLAADEQAMQAASMAVNAGMLDAMDHHLGRLVAHLKATGRFENTIVVVTSDNGPEPTDPLTSTAMRAWLALNDYSRDPATLGERGSFVFIGPEWAWAAATPGDLFKFYTTEGGIRVPFIISGPGIAPDLRVDGLGFVTDVTPTLLDLAGVASEPGAFSGRSLRAMLTGAGAGAYGSEEAVGMEVAGNSALFRGRYKLVRNAPPLASGDWSLFDIMTDPGETRDLAGVEPAILASLQADYASYVDRVGVLPMPAGYTMNQQLQDNSLARQLASWRTWILLGAAIAIAGVSVLLWRRRRH